ncbi:MAG: amidohydrolase [Anaerolineae bacterium]|nr:amidohydrolase [Anaerolineae bacterium]
MIIDELEYYQAVDRAIYAAELADWLPARLFDIHTHAWLPQHCRQPISSERVGLVFEAESVSREELDEAYALLFPGKTVEYCVFGMPLTVIDREANNAYIAAQIDRQRVYGLHIPGLDDSAEVLAERIRAGGYSGFKPYLSYVTWKDLEDIRIIDFVTQSQLEVAHAHGLLIMLHVPRNTRLPDPDNLRDLEMIAARYPGAKVILAHGGRAYSRPLIDRALAVVAALPNMYFDFSNVQQAEVVEAILARMPPERVMYGSDIPVATVRGTMFMLNGQRVAITRKPFPWSISSARPGQLRCTFMGYEQVRAMKTACERLGYTAADVQRLFYDNARALIDSAGRP